MTAKQTRRIYVEAPDGVQFEAEVPCGTKLRTLAADFIEALNWPVRDSLGYTLRAVIALVNPENPQETKRLNMEADLCTVTLADGATLRMTLEALAPPAELSRPLASDTASSGAPVFNSPIGNPAQPLPELPPVTPAYHHQPLAPLTYLDFDLTVAQNAGGRDYPVAARSPAGEAAATCHFPFDEVALTLQLKDLQIALLRSGGLPRRHLRPEQQSVRTFGQTLFDALLVGDVRSRYDVCLRDAQRDDKGVRLRLRIQPPALAALPWEFLYDSRQGEYICLSRHTPIVRYLELPQPIQPLATRLPLRVLGMVVNAEDVGWLDTRQEKARMEQALQPLVAQGLAELHWLSGQTWTDLQRAMRSGPWHIFHFVGHGEFDATNEEGILFLADEQGKAQRLTATQLGRLLADHRTLRLVLLNACEGAQSSQRDIFAGAAATLVRRGIPATLAMQYAITDRAAIEFARAFYEALAEGYPVDAAVAEARKAISLAVTNSVEWGTPVLYMRAPDGVLFDLGKEEGQHE